MSTSEPASIKQPYPKHTHSALSAPYHPFDDDQNSYLKLSVIIKAYVLPVFLLILLLIVLWWPTCSSPLYSLSFWTLPYNKCPWVVNLESSFSPPTWVVVWVEIRFWLGTFQLQTYVAATVCLVLEELQCSSRLYLFVRNLAFSSHSCNTFSEENYNLIHGNCTCWGGCEMHTMFQSR